MRRLRKRTYTEKELRIWASSKSLDSTSARTLVRCGNVFDAAVGGRAVLERNPEGHDLRWLVEEERGVLVGAHLAADPRIL